MTFGEMCWRKDAANSMEKLPTTLTLLCEGCSLRWDQVIFGQTFFTITQEISGLAAFFRCLSHDGLRVVCAYRLRRWLP